MNDLIFCTANILGFSMFLSFARRMFLATSASAVSIVFTIHWLRTKVHVALCTDLYSGRTNLVFFNDLDDSLCYVTCVIMFWT